MKNKMLLIIKLGISFLVLSSLNLVKAQCSELFISEYIEGGGNNKSIEIFNPSRVTVDLASYTVELYKNGNTSSSVSVALTGNLLPDSVFVIVHSSANTALKNHADLLVNSLTFNGDDAITLEKSGVKVDIFGEIGTDPGTSWSNNGANTKDKTLVRKFSIQLGVTVNPSGFDPSVEWDVLPKDDFTNIGMHASACTPTCVNDTTQLAESICVDESFDFNNETLTTAGTYYDTLTNVGGCDSLIVLTLTVNQLPAVGASATTGLVCSGGDVTLTGTGAVVYVWDNNVTDGVAFAPNSTSDYIVLGEDANGCLNTDTITITVMNVSSPTITISTASATLCEGEGTSFTSAITNGGMSPSFQWKRNGSNVGTGLSTYTSQAPSTNNGDVITCDVTSSGQCGTTVVSNTITILVGTLDTVNLTQTICEGDSIVLGAQTLFQAGNYSEVLTNITGCDSLVNLELFVTPLTPSTIQDTICGGDAFQFGSSSLVSTGTYNDTLQAVSGCDSIVTLELFVKPVNETTLAEGICEGETYQFGSQTLSVSGSYVEVFTGANGCDSTSTLLLTVGIADTVVLTQAICEGDTITLGTQFIFAAGSYSDTLINVTGCDSIVNLEVTVNPIQYSTIEDTICGGTPYQFGGEQIISTGSYVDTLQSVAGCDSIVTLELFVKPVATTSLVEFICDGDSYVFDNMTLTLSGTYSDTLSGVNGCDSISTLHLIVGATDTLATSDIICSGDTVVFGTQSLTQTGVYTEVFTSSGGCDSLVSLTLEVVMNSSSNVYDTICSNDSVAFGGVFLTHAGVYVSTILNNAGCDSAITYHLAMLDAYSATIEQEICLGDSLVLGGVAYYQAGTYNDTLQSVNGCDSILSINLSLSYPTDTLVNESICNGSSLVFGSNTITTAGTYTEVFQSNLGCDSTVTMVVALGNSTDTSVVESICQGDIYYFGTQPLTQTGTYNQTFTNVTGCDSVVQLVLSVKVNPIVSITETGGDLIATQGDSYQWYFEGDIIVGATDQTYTPTEPGIYTVEMTAFNGCSATNNYTMNNVSITEISDLILGIAPNPSKGIFNITSSMNINYIVYNLLGDVIEQGHSFNANHTVDLSLKDNGVYILKVVTENNDTIIKRLIKN